MLAAIFFLAFILIIVISKKNKSFSKNVDFVDELQSVEKLRNISLPQIYKDFYTSCNYFKPSNLTGTDLGVENRLNLCDLQIGAVELLEEDEIENFLQKQDFVLMMHQGYQFWYFKADGNPDPTVFYYHEGKFKSDDKGPFSEFVKDFN